MTTDGVLISSARGRAWGWAAVRIDAAADLTETQEYADLNEAGRFDKVVQAERAWTAGLWEAGHHERFDVRYLTGPVTGRISCVVLGRVTAPTPNEAVVVGNALRRRMYQTLPRHVHASEVTDVDEVYRHLVPFQPAATGLAEIRKRIWTARPNRPDAGVRNYMMVQPFTTAAVSWEPLWRALAAQPTPILLSIGLTPTEVPQTTTATLHHLATLYNRLGTPGELPDGLWSTAVRLGADAFAVDAHRIFADAARRYSGRVFRLRITLASPEHLPDSVCELIGQTVSPTERPAEAGALTTIFSGAAHHTVRPASESEHEVAWRNATVLDQAPWDASYLRGLPEQPPPLVRLLCELADPREASSALRLPVAIHGHMPGFPVRHPGLADIVDYAAGPGHITLGTQLVGDREAGPLGMDIQALTRHALFVGTTGSGKTNSTLAFCEQLWRDHHIPFLVIEPVNAEQDDYRWLATRPGFEDLLVLTVGDEQVAPLRLNPFEVPHGVSVGAHIGGLKACFDAAFGLWDPLPAIYDRALTAVYAERGIVRTERSSPRHDGRWPQLADFSRHLARHVESLGYQGDVKSNIEAAAQLRAQSLAHGSCASTLACARSYPITALMDRPVVVELAMVGDNQKEQTLVTALLLSAMTAHYKANRGAVGLAHATVIEEAHRLLGKPVAQSGGSREGNAQALAAQQFANTLAENRKYGEALVIVEQVPDKLVDDAYKNSNLKVMHRLPAEADRSLIGQAMRFSDDQERYAASLAPFTAFAHHDGLDRPALIQVPDVRRQAAEQHGLTRAPLADAAELRARFEAFATGNPAVDQALSPFDECTGCGHRCQFRAHAEAAATAQAAQVLDKRISTYATIPVSARSGWWAETLAWLDQTGQLSAPHDADAAEMVDYHACVMVHLGRAIRSKFTAKWAQNVRDRLARA